MSIIIHFNPGPFIPSAGTIPTSACIKAATAKLEMAPGIKHDTDGPVMTDNSSIVDIATSNTLYERMKDIKATTHHVTQSLGCCFGLPYQDHNYGAPPPPTPPSYSPCASPAHTNGTPDEDTNLSVVSVSTLNEETHEGSITRCVCGFEHDDEYMICCDRCLVWQHVDCMGLDRNNIPETYMCEKCQPRKVDRHKAKVLQARKKVAMTDSSDSDEDRKHSERRPKTRSKSSRRKKEEERNDEKSENVPAKRSRSGKNGKERMEIKRSKLRRSKNKESTSTADEEAQDAWEYSAELCDKHFEAAINNQYTPEVQLIARTLHNQGQEVKSLEQLQVQLCQVDVTEGNRKRLFSVCDMPRGQPVIEYKGKFLLTSQFYELTPLFNKRLYPYVLFHALPQDEICVDASLYGNDARFIRRSCKPNSEIRHVAFNGNLHLYISSTKEIFKDEEITIPFDFCQNDSIKDIDCACEKEYCVLRHNKKNGDGDICEKKKRLRRFTSSADDDGSHSLAGLSSPVKSKHSPVKNSSSHQISPVSTSLIEHMDTKGTSDQEPEEQVTERRKKMTREERKIDAIMRAFDQMEKAAKRRQQALDRLAQQKAQHPKSDEIIEKQEVVTTPVKEEEKPTVISGSETSCVEEEKPPILTPTPTATPNNKPKKGKRRRGSGTQFRRRTRTNSGGSDILSSDDVAPQVPAEHVPVTAPSPSVENNPEILLPTLVANVMSAQTLDSCPEAQTHVLKTKRFLLHEWMHEKSESTAAAQSPCTIQTEVSWNTNIDSPTCSVRFIKDGPNSVGISAAHLRRSSSSGQLKPASGQGSAKKRWLRQAMYDCNTLEELSIIDPSSMETMPSPLHNGCLSPNSHGDANSPGPSSSDDIITPLKKRRLMRESIESMPSPKSPSSVHTSLEWMATSSSTASCQSSSDSKTDVLLTETTDSEEFVGDDEKVELKAMKTEEMPSKINGLREDLIKILTENCNSKDLKIAITSSPDHVDEDDDDVAPAASIKTEKSPKPVIHELILEKDTTFEKVQDEKSLDNFQENSMDTEIVKEYVKSHILDNALPNESANSENCVIKLDCTLPSICNQSSPKDIEELEQHSPVTKHAINPNEYKEEHLSVKQCAEEHLTQKQCTEEYLTIKQSTEEHLTTKQSTKELLTMEQSTEELLTTKQFKEEHFPLIQCTEEPIDTRSNCASSSEANDCIVPLSGTVTVEVSNMVCDETPRIDCRPLQSVDDVTLSSKVAEEQPDESSESDSKCIPSVVHKDFCEDSKDLVSKGLCGDSKGLEVDLCSNSSSGDTSVPVSTSEVSISSASSVSATPSVPASASEISISSSSSVSVPVSASEVSISSASSVSATPSVPASTSEVLISSASSASVTPSVLVSTSEVSISCSDVVTSEMSELSVSSSPSLLAAASSSSSQICSQSSAVSSNIISTDTAKPDKNLDSESKDICTSINDATAITSSACASATQKRKVSLSEYRLRMKEGPSKIRPAVETTKKTAIPSKSTIVVLDTSPKKLSLPPLPLSETKVATPTPIKESKKTPKKKVVLAVDDDACSDTTEHPRENLTERLRREFGLEDDPPEVGSPIPVVVSQPKLPSVSISKMAPVLSLCAQQPPPPPPPPPPRLPRNSQPALGAPTSSARFNYPLSQPFVRPPFLVSQVPASSYINPQPPMASAGHHALHHQLASTNPPHPMLTMMPYAPSLPGAALRPPTHDYASVNAQNFATLIQQPPPPPTQGYPMYQTGFFK